MYPQKASEIEQEIEDHTGLGSKSTQVQNQGVSTKQHNAKKQPTKKAKLARKRVLFSSQQKLLKLQPTYKSGQPNRFTMHSSQGSTITI